MGAIGSHLAYCLYKNKAKITGVCRGKHYLHIKNKGLKIKIYENKIKLKENVVWERKNRALNQEVLEDLISTRIIAMVVIKVLALNHQEKDVVRRIK